MTAMTTTAARSKFSKVLDKVALHQEPVALTRRGKVVGALVSPEDYEYLQRVRAAEDAEDIREADKAMRRFERTGKAIPWEDIKKKHGLK